MTTTRQAGSWQEAFALGLLAATAALPVTAQSGNDEISLFGDLPPPVDLDVMAVTATRNPLDVFLYPGMVSVVEPDQLKRLQPSTPDDMLKLIPNVEFTGGPRRSGEVPSIRGFSGPDVVVLLDGARQNFGSAHDGRFFLDPSLLRSVEVLRGPASSLYGSGGTGGVMAFRTIEPDDFLDPGDTAGITVSAGGQAGNDERVGTVTTYAKTSQGIDLLGSVTRRQSGDIELGDGNTLNNTDDDIVSGLLKGSTALGEHQRLEASYQRFSNDAEEPNNPQGLGGDDSVDKTTTSDNYRLAYHLDDPSNVWLDLDALLYYTEFSADETRLDELGAGPEGERLKRDVDTLGMRIDNRSRLALSDAAALTFTYGTEAYRDEQNGAAGSGERDGVPDAEARFGGLFGQSELELTRPLGLPGELLLLAGLRYDYYDTSSDLADSDTTDDRLSPRFGASYLPREWLLLFANYAEAFRAPTFDELYLTGTHFQIPVGSGIVNRFVPNPDLDPQTTKTVEFGAGVDFEQIFTPDDAFSLKVSHFRVRGEDFIDLSVNQPTPFTDCNPFIPGDCDGTSNATNIPKAKLWGNEVEARYENARMLAGVGFSTLDGENDDTGDKLGLLTPNTFTANAALKLPEFDALVGWRGVFAREFDKVNDPSEKRDAYNVHDLYAAWAPSSGALKGLRIDLGVDNVFDEDYARVFTGASEMGRNPKILVSYSLNW